MWSGEMKCGLNCHKLSQVVRRAVARTSPGPLGRMLWKFLNLDS